MIQLFYKKSGKNIIRFSKNVCSRRTNLGLLLYPRQEILCNKAFQKIRPDRVTRDVNMPGADGTQALRAILKIDPHAKVIMISSVEEKHIVQDAIKLGARDYVVKPFDRANVPLTLNKVIRQR